MSENIKKQFIPDQQVDWRQESGALKMHLLDPTITEIMINRWDRIFIERAGVIEESPLKFNNVDQLWRFVQAIAVIVKRELNNRHPYLDARLPDGSRLNVVIPPITLDGPTLTIRKFNPNMVSFQQMIQMGVLDDKAVYFLNQAVQLKQNIIVSGGTGSGKTTLLNILSSFIPSKERVITLEDTAELQVNVKNVVRMETRPQLGSEPAVTMHQLLKNALRMRPDRIIVGECRGVEAWDMLVAMNTGHEGSLTTLHANSGADALRRLESMILQTGLDAPRDMIQEDISKTISLIIQTERGFDGRRRIVEIIELQGRNGTEYKIESIFQNFNGKTLKSTGVVPNFVNTPRVQKNQFPQNFFDPGVKIRLTA
ncbi:MAG: CpaF family protein [Bdellovibrionaceae bacterium]|nr:CpaF family protein [Pseudobdellovibrionaceae bacterium]